MRTTGPQNCDLSFFAKDIFFKKIIKKKKIEKGLIEAKEFGEGN
jgi:hypothetical protein